MLSVIHKDDGWHVVTASGEGSVAGPFTSNGEAWDWIDRNENDKSNYAAERQERIRDAARDRLRSALSGLVRVFVNPYDGGEFEAGEVPELDAARAALSQEQ